VLRDNIQGITKPAIRRLARRGGVKRISGLVYAETRSVLRIFLGFFHRRLITDKTANSVELNQIGPKRNVLRFSRRRKPLRVQQSWNKPAAPDAGVAATAARWLPLGPMRLRVRRMPIVHRDVGKGQRRGEDGRGGKDGGRRETGEVPSTACCHEGRGECRRTSNRTGSTTGRKSGGADPAARPRGRGSEHDEPALAGRHRVGDGSEQGVRTREP
jgi:hypothetical protein